MRRDQQSTDQLRLAAEQSFRAGVRAADPRRAVQENLEISPLGRPVIAAQELSPTATLRIVAFGKAAASMAAAASGSLSAKTFAGPGIVAVNLDNYRDLERFEVFASGHPIPDGVGVSAAAAVERYLAESRDEDGLLVLISGGGSALLPSPAPGLSLEDKIETTRLLLASGAPIQEINAVRKHLSVLKGGGLARLAFPARVESLILSDVIGDDLSTVASGPTAPDPTTFQDVAEILARYGLSSLIPAPVRSRVERGLCGEIDDTPDSADPVFERVSNRLVGSNTQSLAAARARVEALGFETFVVSEALLGEAREAASAFVSARDRNWSGERPMALLAGGETTVTLRGQGCGGRNQEMALAFALQSKARPGSGEWAFLSAGTDGQDGCTDAAGGIVDAGTVDRVRGAGLDPTAELEENNSYAALSAAGDLLRTGPTGTNVADLQILLLSPEAPI